MSHEKPHSNSTNFADDQDKQTDEPPQEPPYGAEYAKSGRSGCKSCSQPIPKGELRMAVRYQSKIFDGFMENWFHFNCFWTPRRSGSVKETLIRGMEWLKWEDQERIREKIREISAGGGTSGTPGGRTPGSQLLKIEISKSGSGKCQLCSEKISKGSLRVATKAHFHHLDCFANNPLGEGKTAKDFSGYDLLDDDQKSAFNILFPSTTSTKSEKNTDRKRKAPEDEISSEVPTSSKKSRKSMSDDPSAQLKSQSEILWKTREKFMKNLSREEIEELLEINGRFWPKKGGMDTALRSLVDCAVFGPPKSCPECKEGCLIYSDKLHSYKCYGMVSEYTRCIYTTRQPERGDFIIPKEMKESNEFLDKLNLKNLKLKQRVYPIDQPEAAGPSNLQKSAKVTDENIASGSRKARKSKAGKSAKSVKQTLVVKGGYVVDPDCEVAETTHVYVDLETKKAWQATLSSVDMHSGRNSFYKLQLLQHDSKRKFYLFRSWGRTGTDVGGNKTESFGSELEDCKDQFCRIFKEKTRNEWDAAIAGVFKKHPFGLDLVEMATHYDDKNPQAQEPLDIDKSTSKLPRNIKEIIAMIFDQKMLNEALKEFEIDTEKMPLGKISRKNVLAAYQVLSDLQKALDENETLSKTQLIDFSNRFYTIIPQSFELTSPPLIKNKEMIKEKTELLDNLLEIEIAYSVIRSEGVELIGEQKQKKDIIDVHYEKLMCEMEPLDKNAAEFDIITKYVKNTHAQTHDLSLEIIDIIKVDRHGESERFRADIGNVQLLWHGSPLSNYIGILSQGLRIAPPEAPVTGYMFGKGIYTADLVTKAANYCHALEAEGLILLCEVALGQIQEEKDARNIKKLKAGINSVKGLGGTVPDPSDLEKIGDVVVPCGKPMDSDAKGLSLLYNEYIVYDESQVRLRYVVRAKFHTKSKNLL